jgi:hypothetical protein
MCHIGSVRNTTRSVVRYSPFEVEGGSRGVFFRQKWLLEVYP